MRRWRCWVANWSLGEFQAEPAQRRWSVAEEQVSAQGEGIFAKEKAKKSCRMQFGFCLFNQTSDIGDLWVFRPIAPGLWRFALLCPSSSAADRWLVALQKSHCRWGSSCPLVPFCTCAAWAREALCLSFQKLLGGKLVASRRFSA